MPAVGADFESQARLYNKLGCVQLFSEGSPEQHPQHPADRGRGDQHPDYLSVVGVRSTGQIDILYFRRHPGMNYDEIIDAMLASHPE